MQLHGQDANGLYLSFWVHSRAFQLILSISGPHTFEELLGGNPKKHYLKQFEIYTLELAELLHACVFLRTQK